MRKITPTGPLDGSRQIDNSTPPVQTPPPRRSIQQPPPPLNARLQSPEGEDKPSRKRALTPPMPALKIAPSISKNPPDKSRKISMTPQPIDNTSKILDSLHQVISEKYPEVIPPLLEKLSLDIHYKTAFRDLLNAKENVIPAAIQFTQVQVEDMTMPPWLFLYHLARDSLSSVEGSKSPLQGPSEVDHALRALLVVGELGLQQGLLDSAGQDQSAKVGELACELYKAADRRFQMEFAGLFSLQTQLKPIWVDFLSKKDVSNKKDNKSLNDLLKNSKCLAHFENMQKGVATQVYTSVIQEAVHQARAASLSDAVIDSLQKIETALTENHLSIRREYADPASDIEEMLLNHKSYKEAIRQAYAGHVEKLMAGEAISAQK